MIKKAFFERANLHLVGDKREWVINVVNTPAGEALKAGTVKVSKILGHAAEFRVKDGFFCEKSFHYRKGKCEMRVKVFEKKGELFLDCEYFVNGEKNRNYRKFYSLKEEKGVRRLGILGKEIIFIGVNVFYRLARMVNFGKKKRTLFLTENATELSGNLKKIYDEWQGNKSIFAQEMVNAGMSMKYWREILAIAKCDTIIIDNYTPVFTHLNLAKKVKLAQVWHAGVGFKSVGYARFGLDGSPHPFVSGHRKYTHVFVDMEELVPIYAEVFGVDEKKIHVTGMPRLDGYLDLENIKEECAKLDQRFLQKKVILFAPTYRGEGMADAYYDFDWIDLKKVHAFCEKNDCLFVMKWHPFIKERLEIPEEYWERIFDCSEEDINRLIYVTDVMVTDYSSCVYEFSLFKRPLIFYRPDKSEYEENRPLYTIKKFAKNQDEVKDFDELLKKLERIDVRVEKRFEKVSKERSERKNATDQIRKILGDMV